MIREKHWKRRAAARIAPALVTVGALVACAAPAAETQQLTFANVEVNRLTTEQISALAGQDSNRTVERASRSRARRTLLTPPSLAVEVAVDPMTAAQEKAFIRKAQAEAKAAAELFAKAEAARVAEEAARAKAAAEKAAAEKAAAEKAAAEKAAAEKAAAEKAAAEKAAAEKAAAEAKKKAEAAAAAAKTVAPAPPAPASGPVSSASSNTPDQNRALARQMMLDRGWGEGEWPCLNNLWTKESNFRHTAQNPSSGAGGIPQALPASKMGAGWQDNPAQQINWGLNYIAGRYKSPCGAWSAFQQKNWY